MPVMSFDVARVRGLYPTVGAGTAQLEGSFSAVQPESVIRAIISTLRSSPAQPGSRSERSQRSAASVLQARRAVADLVGASADSVVLGTSTFALLHRMAGMISRDWQLGDEVVLSRMDADANLQPWQRVARSAGAAVHWAEVDLETGELPAWQYERLINGHTRVVTVPLANAATGTVPDVRMIAALAHRHGALVVVDAGAAVPYLPIDLDDLGADLLVLNASTFGGPTMAAVVARPGLLAEIGGDLTRPIPQRFELDPLPIELLDGLTAAIDHIADLDQFATGSRRERIVTSVEIAGDYQRRLFDQLDAALRDVRGLTVLGSSSDRLPVAAFTAWRRSPDEVGEQLRRRGVSVWTGPSGMTELMSAIGADELGGACFLGLMPHTSAQEVDQLLDALSDLLL
ncbi:MAG TPA: aminotransferase class V-fold PLP-dependent enzyme [Jatrophihabitantaceae bacterium]|nr:aminotransferase class V-fold PLP-dependent enzyme [Jatrophihabitantaceae bacterium]